MNRLTIDFETFYDSKYSLKDMMTAEYIYDSRFEVICVSVKENDGPAQWCSGDWSAMALWLRQFDWEHSLVCAHNVMFDGAILEWKFGFKGLKYFCSMMGSRPHVVPYTNSMGLKAVAEYFEVGHKGSEVENHKGRHRMDFSTQQLTAYSNYCKQDVELCFSVTNHLLKILPVDEQDLIDLTIRKFIHPVLLLDNVAIETREAYLDLKRTALEDSVKDRLGMTIKDIRSRKRFLQELEKRNVSLPVRKVLDSKGGWRDSVGMSKKDPEFLELLAHANKEVRLMALAKMEFGSTIEPARLARFKILYNCIPGHLLPIPLLYYGAHPGRFSGLDGLNMQNLPRPRKADPDRAALRKAIIAPEGYVIIAADFSNIEARIVAALAEEWELVRDFANGVDIYSQFASLVYRKTINKRDHPIERFVGKTCILGLGYGMGHKKLSLTLATSDDPVNMDQRMAFEAVSLYRRKYPNIPELWSRMEQKVRQHCLGSNSLGALGPVVFTTGRIILPNGMPIIYNDLDAREGLMYGDKYLWGGSITENVVQALARIIATRAELRLARAGLRAVHQAHDELIFCVPIEHVDVCEKAIERIMTDPVDWLPKLPIAVEIHHGATYGDCKG